MFSRQPKLSRAGRGFSLIELLVVIAIIAILAAILFPVFALVKEDGRKTVCMSHLHDIYVAVSQYKLDNNTYPAALYDYAELAGGAYYVGVGSPVAMDMAKNRPLIRITGGRYLKDPALFTCPDIGMITPTDVTTAVYPPGLTLVGLVPNEFSPANPAYFYKLDSYDVGPQVDAKGRPVLNAGVTVMERHYSRSWTNVTGPGDSPNQLKYPDPPADKTVLTWCTYHVAEAHSSTIPVVMLSGTCRPVATDRFVNQGPVNFKY